MRIARWTAGWAAAGLLLTSGCAPAPAPGATPHAPIATSPSSPAQAIGLGPLPVGCPTSSQPISPVKVGPWDNLAGGRPVWTTLLATMPGAPLSLSLPQSYLGGSLHRSEHGYGLKHIWIVEPGTPPVTIHGGDLGTGAPLWFQMNGAGDPTTMVRLDSSAPGTLGGQADAPPEMPYHWAQFPGGIFLPAAGCYFIEASWPTGSWRLNFPAGTVPG